MPGSAVKLAQLLRRSFPPLIGALLLTGGSLPARAQDLFGFFRPAVAPPAYQPYHYRPLTTIEVPTIRIRPRARPASVEGTGRSSRSDHASSKKRDAPRAPGETTNPVPELLGDSTLRPGDMVMFPDGLRVFTGRPGGQHRLTDFQSMSRAGNAVTSSIRKLASQLKPGVNVAWSADGVKASAKLEARTRDAQITRSTLQNSR